MACFPPPHQFFFPRDLTDNLKTVWYGRDHRGLDGRLGFGIRQAERGGGSFVPWFNAPPGTDQRLGVFYLLSDGDAEQAVRKPCATPTAIVSRSCPAITRLPAIGTWRPPMAAIQEKTGATTDDSRLGPHVQRHGCGDRPSRRVPRRRPPARPRPASLTRDGGDVRRVQAPLRRRAPGAARRRGQHRPGPGPRRARRPATGCISFPGRSTGP